AIAAYTFVVTSAPAPTGLTATPVSSSRINLSWDPVPAATSYRIYRSSSQAGPYALLTTSTNTSKANTGLTSGTTYYYTVQAVAAGGRSPQSGEAHATTP